jgi:hypothetical protein
MPKTLNPQKIAQNTAIKCHRKFTKYPVRDACVEKHRVKLVGLKILPVTGHGWSPTSPTFPTARQTFSTPATSFSTPATPATGRKKPLEAIRDHKNNKNSRAKP